MVSNIRTYLEQIANWFAGFGVPDPIANWGHPLMMGILVVVLGTYTAWVGWQGRIAKDVPKKQSNARYIGN